MQRNTVIAIALSIAIMVGWNAWYYHRYKDVIEVNRLKQTQKKEPDKKESAPIGVVAPQTLATPSAHTPVGDALAGAPQQPAVVRKISVDTGVSKVTLSTIGGVITSYQLSAYLTNGAPTELVDLKAPALPLSLEFATPDASRKINSASFVSEAPDAITLSAGNPTASVAFSLQLENGVRITKKLTFHHASYMVGLDAEVASPTGALAGSAYGLSWTGLGGAEGTYSYIGPVVLADGKRLADAPKEKETKTYDGNILWGGLTNKYYCTAFIPASGKAHITANQTHTKGYGVSLQLLSGTENHLSFYAGPKDHRELEKAGSELKRMINYGWFDIIAHPLFWALLHLNSLVGNFGVSIILITVFVKLLFWPLSQSSFKSVEKMKKIQPQMKMIQERYKNDKAKMNEELIGLYKKYNVNPMAGCLPIILQIPVFVALYKVLLESIDLKGAPFILWVHDLSMKDPYYVTPILMGISMFVQQKMSPSSSDPIQKNMMLAMPVIFTVMFINFPSGLVIYWLVNNLLSIFQQYMIRLQKNQEA